MEMPKLASRRLGERGVLNLSFAALLFAQLLVLSASSALCFAMPLWLLDCGGSAALYGVVGALAFVPYVCAMPVGGVLADAPHSHTALSIVAAGMSISAVSALLLCHAAGPVTAVLIVLCLQYGLQALAKPGIQTLAVRLVGQDLIERATALVSQVTMASNILGPVMGAGVYGCWGIDALSLAAALCFAVAAVCLLMMRVPKIDKTIADAGARHGDRPYGVKGVVDMLLTNRVLLSTVALAAVVNVVLAGMTIGSPIIVTRDLDMPSSWTGAIEACMGAGGIVGGCMVSLRPGAFSFARLYRYVGYACIGIMPVCTTFLVHATALPTFIALAVGSAWLMVWANVASVEIVSHVQRETPHDMSGKMLSVVYMALTCATPLGQLLYGFAYDAFATPAVLVGMFAALMLVAWWFYRIR